MRRVSWSARKGLAVLAFVNLIAVPPTDWVCLRGADLVLELTGRESEIRFVGAVQRWEADGRPRRVVDPKGRIEMPQVDSIGRQTRPGLWTCANVAPGRYDLILLGANHLRIEGFHYPAVLEFDTPLVHTESVPREVTEWIREDIAKSPHYENKVNPLFFGGTDRQVRVLVQLLRDDGTSFDAEFGQPVSTLRHEIWQYTYRYGAWSKERRTRVLDRVLMARRELSPWTWVWMPELGGIEVGSQPRIVRFSIPQQFATTSHRGLIADSASR